MRPIAVALGLVVVAVSPARGDGPIVINADLGINMPLDGRSLHCYPDHASQYRPVLNLDVGYRFMDQLAAGVHAGVRQYPWEDCGGNIPGAYQMYRGIDTALELGVAAQWSTSRFWLAAWLGIEDVGAGAGRRTTAYAVAGGVDAYVHPSGHRVGVYLDLTNIPGDFDSDEQHLSAGIAYRYW